MYLIDKEKNRISKLKQMTFSELKFREREHLQEWIANNPNSLGEELLIIQKEFRIVVFAFLLLFLNACKTSYLKFNSESPQTLTNQLASLLQSANQISDDPSTYDSLFHNKTAYKPKLSNPFWLIPSIHLPADVKPQNSNNNVSIAIYGKRLFVAFRTGPTHFASRKTGIYIIYSTDGSNWIKEFELFPGRDVREPFLIAINDTLHFYCFAAGKSMTAFEPEYISHFRRLDSAKWSSAENVLEKGEVHWSMLNRFGTTWMTSYMGSHYALKGESAVKLMFKQTEDGRIFRAVGENPVVYVGGVSETAFEFDEAGNLWAVTRNEDGDKSGFGSHVVFAHKDSIDKWQFPAKTDPNCYMSPKMFRHGNELYLIARKQVGKKPFERAKTTKSWRHKRLKNWMGFSLSAKTTALYCINKTQKTVEWVMDLPGNGDTAFPSVLRLSANSFLVANYSSPTHYRKRRTWLNGQLGKTGIYLQIITFEAGK